MPLPTRYCTPALPLTLLAHPSAIHATRRTAASLNVTHATSGTHRNTDTNSRRGPPPDRDRSRSRERQASSMNRSRQQSLSTPRSTGRAPSSRNYDIQCDACTTNGHNHTDCRLFPKVAAILDYITHHPSESKAALYQYKKAQHPDTRRAARDKIIKVLKRSTIQYDNLADEDAHIEALADQLTGEYRTDTDDHAASICRLRTIQPTDHQDSASCTIISTSTPPTSNTLRQSANCVRLPDLYMMQVPRTPYPT